jgi:predicted peroxiredoxin
MSVIPVAREAEFQRLSEDFYRARGMDPRGDDALVFLMGQAYLLGKSDGMDRGAEVWRKAFEEMAKAYREAP